MRIRLSPGLLLAATLAVAASVGPAQTPPANPPSTPEAPKTSAIRLPSGGVIVVTDNPADLASKLGGVVLTPEKYRELTDLQEQVRRLTAVKPVAPASCELEGKIESRGGAFFVRFKAAFRCRTVEANRVVALGCQKAQATEARLEDGKLPLLSAGENGLSVLLETPGEHLIRVELEVPVTVRGVRNTEVGIDFGLPSAPITTLSLTAPDSVREVVLTRRDTLVPLVPERRRVPLSRLQPGMPEALGAVSSLELSWEPGEQPSAVASARSAEGDLIVRIGETDIDTEARLRLRGRGIKEWKIQAPSTADLNVQRAGATLADPGSELPGELQPTILRPEANAGVWKVQFRQPPVGDLLVVVRYRTTRARQTDPRSTFRQTVGPVAVADLPPQAQSAVVRVVVPQAFRIADTRRGETRRPEIAELPGGELQYRFVCPSLPGGNNGPTQSPLDIDIRPAGTVIIARTTHRLRLADGGWRVTAEIALTPVRTEIDRLEVDLPAEVQNLQASPAKIVEGLVPVRDGLPGRRVYQIRLAAPRRDSFTIALDGLYPQAPEATSAKLSLSRLPGTTERDGTVQVIVPEGLEVRGTARSWVNDKPGSLTTPLIPSAANDPLPGGSLTVSPPPALVELTWQPQKLESRVENLTDATLADSQIRVSQSMQFPGADKLPRRIRLKGMPLSGSTVGGVGVTPGSLESGPSGEWFLLPGNAPASRDAKFVFQWAQPLAGRTLTVPVIAPEGTTLIASKVRIWRDGASQLRRQPTSTDPAWQPLPSEILGERDTLPLLVLGGNGGGVELRLDEPSEAGLGDADRRLIAERGLVQAMPGETGWKFRARWQLRRWTPPGLEIDLPPGATDPEVRINDKRAEVRESEGPTPTERMLKVSLPAWKPTQVLRVEVRWNLPTADTVWATHRWSAARLRGNVPWSVLRWQVSLPGRTVPLLRDDTPMVEDRWTWKGGLPAVVGSRTPAELERWLTSGAEPSGDPAWEVGESVLCARGGGDDTLEVVLVPKSALLGLVTLAVFLPVPVVLLSGRRWSIRWGVLLVSAVAATAVAWPQMVHTVSAAAVPALATLLLAGLLWLARRWYAGWQVRHLPAFRRQALPSSLVQKSRGPGGSGRQTGGQAGVGGLGIPPVVPLSGVPMALPASSPLAQPLPGVTSTVDGQPSL